MLVSLALAILPVAHALSPHGFRLLGPQAVKLWQLEQRLQPAVEANNLAAAASFPPGIVEGTFTQPLDHFDNQNPFTFQQHFWVNSNFYKPGGPVILLEGGEAPGLDRVPFISTGVAAKLANATGGLCMVLEHRYYGNSVPVANFSTDSLRWLTNDQAMADSANFMANINFTATTGIHTDLTAPGTPYIYYGGSYAGARSAHMRVKYPELTYGAIASSGVTHASVALWQYFDVVRNAAPNCSSVLVDAVQSINVALARPDLNTPLKQLFGLDGLADDDFASILTSPLGGWQNHNWDPAIDSDGWTPFCETIAAKPSDPSLQTGHIGNLSVGFGLLNFANYSQINFAAPCLQNGLTITQCYATTDDAQFQVDDLSQTWRPWQFQGTTNVFLCYDNALMLYLVCTAWGFFIDAPPPNIPAIAAKALTVPYLSKICKQAYPPGQFFTVPDQPDVASVNALGGFHISADRLAIVDGELDPWRPATPHSSYAYLPPREDTTLRPFKLIPGAVHHWDENGLPNTSDEPPAIQAIHNAEIGFVKAWLKDFKPSFRI
ncbi:serine carboxypeptidase S28-domain-containing protein [Gautieria morchelliformis]|nr:serine carboxypeptidase S28-domain-containing protein [Gautieria morchelliformis]